MVEDVPTRGVGGGGGGCVVVVEDVPTRGGGGDCAGGGGDDCAGVVKLDNREDKVSSTSKLSITPAGTVKGKGACEP